MADVEEKFADEYLFDRYYIASQIKLITSEVYGIIENLNSLSKDKYIQLYNIFNNIAKECKS